MRKEPVLLVTGACGQIGTELVKALRAKYGRTAVIASDIRGESASEEEPYLQLDVLDKSALSKAVRELGVSHIYHLAAVLSASGEKDPEAAWHLNIQSLLNVLDVARHHQLQQVFWPSSIAVFGPEAPKVLCPQNARTEPTTVYGISKSAGEQWCRYYFEQYGLDVRSLRFPGLISHSSPAGGGTTDYAVDIFHQALESGVYSCFLKPDTRLPMLYMDDAVRATLELMDANRAQLTVRTAYNLAGLSFTPAELARELQARLPGFQMNYQPDERQKIADSWPWSINDQAARKDWGWQPAYDLGRMCTVMWQALQHKLTLQEK
jgi:nucleoside-diphosphate-sugar epimerase